MDSIHTQVDKIMQLYLQTHPIQPGGVSSLWACHPRWCQQQHSVCLASEHASIILIVSNNLTLLQLSQPFSAVAGTAAANNLPEIANRFVCFLAERHTSR